MKYKCLVIIIWLLFTGTLNFSAPVQDRIDKAFKSLAEYNYFDARDHFQKSAKKYPCITGYGLSVIYYRTDNPFHNIDSAYARINESIAVFNQSGKQEYKKLKELNINRDTLLVTQSAISQLAFTKAVSSGDVQKLNHFIEVYSRSSSLETASHIRDSIAFKLALKENSSESYQQYMNLYPESYLFNEAKVRYDKSLYDESVFDRKESSYARFAEAYPQSPHASEAMFKVYEMATDNSNDPEIYHRFIMKYPGNNQVEDAWQRIFELNVITYDETSIQSFKIKYPDYPYKDKLEEDIRLSRIILLTFKEQLLYGLMGVDSKVVVEPKYDFIGKFSDGIATVSLGEKMGYITKSGEEIIPPFFDDAEDFHNSLAIVGDGSRYGVINRSGKMVVPLSYFEIGDYSEGLAAAFDGKLYGYISRSGKTVIPFIYQSAGEFKNGMAICQDNVYFGVINSSDKVVVPFKYETLEWFDEYIFKFSMNERVGLINADGSLLLPGDFDEIGPFRDGRSVIIKGGKLGYADLSGKMVISMSYDAGKDALVQSEFHNGLAIVKKQNRAIVIDTSGKAFIRTNYEDMILIGDTLMGFRQKGHWGIRTIGSNKILTAPKYDQIFSCSNDNCVASVRGKYGVTAINGKILIPFVYESLLRLKSGLFVGMKSGKFGVVELTNQEIIPFLFDNYIEKEPGFIEFSNSVASQWLDVEKWQVFTRN